MSGLELIFQQEPGQATPRLRPSPGSVVPWNDDDLLDLEAELERQYPELNRGKVKTLTFQNHLLNVRVRKERLSRMPSLILTEAPVADANAMTAPIAGPAWLDGLLTELIPADHDSSHAELEPFERGNLQAVMDELRSLAKQDGASAVAGLLVAGYLTIAEHQMQETSNTKAGGYALALQAVDKLLTRVGLDEAGTAPPRGSWNSKDRLESLGSISWLLRRMFPRQKSMNGSKD
jgi:hypothetical protein